MFMFIYFFHPKSNKMHLRFFHTTSSGFIIHTLPGININLCLQYFVAKQNSNHPKFKKLKTYGNILQNI